MKILYFATTIALSCPALALAVEPLFYPVVIAPRPALPSPAFDPATVPSLETSIRIVPAPVPVVVEPVIVVPVEDARPVIPALVPFRP